MSIKVMSTIWDQSSHEGSTLLLLLALADHASDDGVCWPGIPRLARKARKTERHIKRLLSKLEESGELYVARGIGRGNTNMYYIALSFSEEEMVHTLIKRFELNPDRAAQAANYIANLQGKGDTQDTFLDDGGDIKGDIQGQGKVTPTSEKVTPTSEKGDIAMSPEPSVTIIKPSGKEPSLLSSDEKTVVNQIIEQTKTHPGPEDLARATEKKQAEAGGNYATPAQAGGSDIAAETALLALYVARGSEPPLPDSNTYKLELEKVSQVLRDNGVTDPGIAKLAARFMCEANEESPKFVNPHFRTFPSAFSFHLGQAKNCVADDRRISQPESALLSQEALRERQVAQPPPPQDDTIGQGVKGELASQMSQPSYQTWVASTCITMADGDILVVSAPTDFARDWLENRLGNTIERAAIGIMGKAVKIRFETVGMGEHEIPLVTIEEEALHDRP